MNARIVQGVRYGGGRQREEAAKPLDNRVRVPWHLLERLRAKANRGGRTLEAELTEALEGHLGLRVRRR